MSSRTLALSFVLLASDASANPVDPDAWARDRGLAFGASAPEPIEPSEHVAYPDLDALGEAESWSCNAFEPPDTCMVTASAARLGGGRTAAHAVEEVRVVGHSIGEACYWRLVAKVPEGWLKSLDLGVSAVDCRAPLDGELLGSWSWFPLGMQHDGAAVRIEGQGIRGGKASREVILCRASPGGLACAHEHAETRAPPTRRLALDKTSLPLSRAAEVGEALMANWLARPYGPGVPRMPGADYGYGRARVVRHALAAGGPEVVVLIGGSARVVLERDGQASIVADPFVRAANERIELIALDRQPGLVRLSLALRNEGETTVVWRWDEIIRLVPGGGGKVQHIRVATGVDVRGPDGPSGWSRDVIIEPEGLSLVESDGPLAWFRGVGRVPWKDLGPTLARDHRRAAQALMVAASDAPPFEGFSRRALTLVPGFVEPVENAVLDGAREL